jgi:methylmalonyl-CoA/ethylmalonyl-CoA epimerase
MLPDFQFHHIGIATSSIKNTGQYYLDAGYTISDTVFDSLQNVSIAFLEKKGFPQIELLEPTMPGSPVKKIIESTGVSPYHICYKVCNIETAIKELKIRKYLPLAHPVNSTAMNNRKICFLFNKDVGLIELVEYPE